MSLCDAHGLLFVVYTFRKQNETSPRNVVLLKGFTAVHGYRFLALALQ